ncbi:MULTISPECIES: non-ribosomal peptide synthetase [Streptomyces]|uniref:non-ribosomal peptide synthetase n=1 Tax=Streptomyces TaxID=1883 RepID=UPI00227D89ED|nr:non-ribosomal peptide synthetase [Streptomyces canarius]
MSTETLTKGSSGTVATESVHGLFAQRAAADPDAVAISAHDEELTFAELDSRSGILADRLRAAGVGTEDTVGICLERSAGLIVALLAVLKSGGNYLGLDTKQPRERHIALLEDSGAKVVITTSDFVERLGHSATTLLLDAASAPTPTPPATSPHPATSAQNTAYIAYTSGSSGKPKGVCVPHQGILRLVTDPGFLAVRPDDVFLHFAPVAFDASTFEIWSALLNGCRLVVAPPGDITPADLSAFIQKNQVTVAWLTAGLFHAMVESGTQNLRGLRHLVAGGDVLSAAHVDRALGELPQTALTNGYGPTENTTFTACHTFTGPVADGPVPIGRPIRGTTVHLLDDAYEPVPDGEVGRLYAAGLGLAHGYLNAPALTAERFVPDPFSDVPGARMYDTGDLARRRPDGTLEFHGRADQQVKIRGFRIEPGEIEAALRAHPEITDAAVVAQPASDTERRLTAYYVSEEVVTTAELRRDLGRGLPAYMIPALFVRLDALPLNSNGKVDRARLAAMPRPERPEMISEYRAPATEMETWLTELWADFMGFSPVGVDDDFFELGGHSLMAARITGEISAEYDVNVPPVAFYEHPTIDELAAYLTTLTTDPDSDGTQAG